MRIVDNFEGKIRTKFRLRVKSDLYTTELIPLDPVTPVGGGSTWEPTREQETSFGGESQRTKLMKDYVKDLYKKLSENIGETPEEFHYDYFKLEDGELYYRGKRKPLGWNVGGYIG